MSLTVKDYIKQLDLLPHPEGGFYRETYRSVEVIPQNGLPQGFSSARNFATAIYFLIERNNFSALHKIKSDETWHFYAGNPLEVVEITEEGKLKKTLVGSNIGLGEVFQYTVRANTWFGSRVKVGGAFSLVGCTVSPGFDFNDFEMASREQLVTKYPDLESTIVQLTR